MVMPKKQFEEDAGEELCLREIDSWKYHGRSIWQPKQSQ